MFGSNYENQRIEVLKLQGDAERNSLGANAQKLLPTARAVVNVGAYALAIKNLAPAIKPIVFGLIQRGLAKRGKMGVFKLAGLISSGIGIARAMSRGDSKERNESRR